MERQRRRRPGHRFLQRDQVAPLLKLQDGLAFQLADALAAEAEFPAELLQRAGRPSVDPVADPEDLLLAGIERVEEPVEPLPDRSRPRRGGRARRAVVAHELADRILLSLGAG